MTPDEHAAEVAAWRARRDARLRDPDGWLALVGLHWLQPGENRLGAHPANEVVLRGEGVPPRFGTLRLTDGVVRLARGSALRLADGEPAPAGILADDSGGEPTVLALGTLRMHVIRRGQRIGLRVRDRAAPALATFGGLRHFPVDAAWRVDGRLEPAAPGATLEIVDVIGGVERYETPGTVVFERDGALHRLVALPGDDDGRLWLIFADATTRVETFAGGRYLYTEPVAADGSVVADFNLAYNPPCVFSPHATCPLPPPENRLAIRVSAGELTYPG